MLCIMYVVLLVDACLRCQTDGKQEECVGMNVLAIDGCYQQYHMRGAFGGDFNLAAILIWRI